MKPTVIHADSRDALREMPDASIDACVCDPPYALVSIGKRYGAFTRRVLIADYTQPTGWRIEDMVSTVSSDFTVSIGTLDERSEQTQP